MATADAVFIDAGLFVGALLGDDPRHTEARPLAESARRGEISWCTSAGVLAEVYAALTWVGAQPAQAPDRAAEAVRLIVIEPSSIRVLDTGPAATLKMLDLASGLLRYRAARDGVLVYEARPGIFDRFRFEAARFWYDAEPVLRAGYEALLDRLG